MRVGIMQPYFFPYIGYVSLIKHVDEFILFDTVQFIRHGWIERNRIINPSGGWQYISVPLKKHGQRTVISDIKINNEISWKEKILAQLVHYKKAPYYSVVVDMVQRAFEEEFEDITSLNKKILGEVCCYLNISTAIKTFSKMDIKIDEANAPDEWALNICKEMQGVTEYWNPIGGQDFFVREKYENSGIDIKFLKINFRKYRQGKYEYEEGLSILDVMMFNSVDTINEMLDDFILY